MAQEQEAVNSKTILTRRHYAAFRRDLNTILSLVSQSKCVADVGCDHGFVSIELINRKIAENVIAMDIRQGPLMRAQEHIMQTRLLTKYRQDYQMVLLP